ncbi:hypothetical protein A0H81_04523 [Grifola frondosa]|uniref:SRR1-like domain-containing protein n=1 Tax=Grifola frondosa TaxID=5627 RepID=A0A1C7MF23_GRIFR|nr:hypothetical protein A0H81_04523 [Grifola frondosa]
MQHARYALRAPTLVFMPHCDLHLYENLLRENWTHEGLARLVLIANSLSDYTERSVSQSISPSPGGPLSSSDRG